MTTTAAVSTGAPTEGVETIASGGTPDQMVAAIADQKRHEADNKALKAFAATRGMKIPERFNDNYVAWFDSLKEADKKVTQATQEAADLRKKIEASSSAPLPTDDTPLQIAPKPKETPPAPIVEPAVKITDVEMHKFSDEVRAQGKLSPESLALLKSAGIADNVISNLVDGIRAKHRVNRQAAEEAVGGAANLNQLFKWAQAELPESRIQELNAGLNGPLMPTVLRGLVAEYNEFAAKANAAEASKEPKTPAKNPQPNTATARTPVPKEAPDTLPDAKEPFKTRAEYAAAQRDSRYQRDPNYRRWFESRVNHTGNIAMLPRG